MSEPSREKLSTQTLSIMLMGAVYLTFAPFVPEPHLFGKVRWVMGGAVGMEPLDWFDLAMHGISALVLPFLVWKVYRRWRKYSS